jgi:hypothetical protein
LSIACHDVGQYVDHIPLGKKYFKSYLSFNNIFRIIEKLGIKQSIMRLIAHEDSEVRYYALNTVQKYMSNLWSAI